MAKNAEKQNLIALYEQKMREAGQSDWWVNFHLAAVGEIVELTDGSLVVIEKGHIQKDFPFYRDIYGYEVSQELVQTARTSVTHFKRENLKGFQSWIDTLEQMTELWIEEDGGKMRIIVPSTYEQPTDASKLMGMEDRRRILDGYKRAYAAFEKRLDAYLKRYGLSHVRAWSWSD